MMTKEQDLAFAELLLAAQYAVDWYPDDASPPYMSGIVEAVQALAANGVRVGKSGDGFPTVYIEGKRYPL